MIQFNHISKAMSDFIFDHFQFFCFFFNSLLLICQFQLSKWPLWVFLLLMEGHQWLCPCVLILLYWEKNSLLQKSNNYFFSSHYLFFLLADFDRPLLNALLKTATALNTLVVNAVNHDFIKEKNMIKTFHQWHFYITLWSLNIWSNNLFFLLHPVIHHGTWEKVY